MNIIEERKGLVGKRILICNRNDTKTCCDKLPWQCGYIRCASTLDEKDDDFMVYIEWDESRQEWRKLEDFKNVFIERRITITQPQLCKQSQVALVFRHYRGTVLPSNHQLVEFFNDRHRAFVKESSILVVEEEDALTEEARRDPSSLEAVSEWLMVQRTQAILGTDTSGLPGSRVLVYTPPMRWSNALISKQGEDGTLHVVNEQVLTHTTVDPSLTQVRFLDGNLVEELIRGEVVVRRSRRSKRYGSCTALDSHKCKRATKQKRSALTPSGGNETSSGTDAPSPSAHPRDSSKRVASPHVIKPTLCLSKSAPTSSLRHSSKQLPHQPSSPRDCDATVLDAAQSLVNILSNYKCKQDVAVASAPPDPTGAQHYVSTELHQSVPTVLAPKPVHACKPTTSHAITSPVMTSQSRFVPNSQSGSFEAYKKSTTSATSEELNKPEASKMHPSQHSRALSAIAAQQALIQQAQQQQSQQQSPQQNQQLPQMLATQQLLANPYLSPYALPLLYGNPQVLAGGLNATALAQAQLAAANRTMAPQMMMPWLKDLQQQQAVYAALRMNKPPEGVAAYPALFFADPSASGSSSPKPPASRTPPGREPQKSSQEVYSSEKVRERLRSPHAALPKNFPQASASPRRSHDPEGSSLARAYPHEAPQTPPLMGQGTYQKHSSQPQSIEKVAIMKERDRILKMQQDEKRKLEEAQVRKLQELERKQELEREFKRKEELWKSKLTKGSVVGKPEDGRLAAADKRRTSELSQGVRSDKMRVWGMDQPTARGLPPLAMVDPATFLATHAASQAARLINEETVRQNGAPDKALSPLTPQAPAGRYQNSDAQPPKTPISSAGQSVASSKIWQPPVAPAHSAPSAVRPQHDASKLMRAPPQSTPSTQSLPHGWPRIGPPPQVKPPTSSVVNIHELKYNPPSSPASSKPPALVPPSQSPVGSSPTVKTTLMASNRDPQTVKYISDRKQPIYRAPPRSPSPPLGPLMADGSRARILSEAKLKSLHHFPGPSSKPTAKTNDAKPDKPSEVIIDEPGYKVTEVKGSKDRPAMINSSPSHLVYAKHSLPARVEESVALPDAAEAKNLTSKVAGDPATSARSARKRSIDAEESEVGKKICRDDELPVYFPRYSTAAHATDNLPSVKAANDPLLRELIAKGYFGVANSGIVWNDPTQIVNQYPGTPSKVMLKDALLGLKNENGWNLSTNNASPMNHVASTSSPSQVPHAPPSVTSAASHVDKKPEVSQRSMPSPPTTNNKASSPTPVKSPPTPDDLSMKTEKPTSDGGAGKPVVLETASPKTPAASSTVSPGSDASSMSDFSWGANKGKSPANDCVATKSGACPKLKKAWLKRMSDESDDAAKSSVAKALKRKNSEEFPTSPLLIVSSPPTPTDPSTQTNSGAPCSDQEAGETRDLQDDLAPPVKKPKKKHRNKDKEKKNKDPNKKKKKHKDKDGKKHKKNDHSESSSASSMSDAKDDPPANPGLLGTGAMTNSKLYLIGKLSPSNSEEGGESSADGSEAKKGKKKAGKKMREEMPLGENGLPISVLLCKKEQARLKKSGEAFVQDAACHEITGISGVMTQTLPGGLPSVPKCRECRNHKRKESTVFCRFYGFRKLAFIGGHLHASGFSHPEDSRACDIELWLPQLAQGSNKEPSIDVETCFYVMKNIGGKFCELVQEEREAMAHATQIAKLNWKRPVSGVREMCDACETTLFNLHWVCDKCGFGVCSDCYKRRQKMSNDELEAYDSDKSKPHRWLTCTKGRHHAPSHLVPAQIIPSSCLFDLCELAHQARAKWSITSQCRCKKAAILSASHAPRLINPTPLLKNHCNSELLSHNSGKAVAAKPDLKPALNRDSNRLKGFECEGSASPLDWLASIALREQRKSSVTSAVTSSTVKNSWCDDKKGGKEATKVTSSHRGPLTSSDSCAPRSWLCYDQLLQLTDSSSGANVDSFQPHWDYGMPVMASGASSNLNRELWKPETFSREHGDQPTGNALINCRRGSVITNARIRDFWTGFECIKNRLRDERSGERMILKLKDWPTTDDFIDTMPDKFADLMRCLPLPQYTGREGKFNMASYLPDCSVRPDLGPKMYIAYGWVSESDWNQGTTNLHLDISDACNLMVYVGIPSDEPASAQDALLKIMKEGDVDPVQIERTKTCKPGALWHIFKAADTDKIRKLILKVKAEKGTIVSDDHDPIHDQQVYLDRSLRRRLKEEYGVEGYPLVQCEGDSVFIPAGAPHQVFNLHSCIKVAEDFVSPEHVDKCFKLTEEFRHLSTTHSNHEDKLQLKNIIFHTMKEIVASLSWHEAHGGLNKYVTKAAPTTPPG